MTSRSRRYSLRRRLIAATLGSSIVVGLVSTAIVVGVAWHETSETFDDALEESARTTLSLGVGLARSGAIDDDPVVDRQRERVRLRYQIVSAAGEVVRRADGAPRRPFVDRYRRDERFYDVRVDRDWWRVHVLHHDEPAFSVQVGQQWEERTELLTDTIESLVWPMLVLWALLGLFNWWAIRRLLTPLEALATGIAAKSSDDLSPVQDAGQASELQPVLAALNQLLGRLGRALEGERRFTADAAHELRTPLAAVGSRIQLMQRTHQAAASPALADDLQQLRDDIARSTALVENLLQLARLDPESSPSLAMAPVDLPALLREVVRACASAATARQVTVEIDCRVDRIRGHRDWLYGAIRNLVDNAVRHGRAGGRVAVRARRGPDGIMLSVDDDGPGVDAEHLERLTQRFYRVLGGTAQGSGLGLSIVARIAALHGATVAFGPGLDGRGFGVTLRFSEA
ncbi:MAG: ATP-binding protein [Burkholderiaceae bacterium]